MIELSIKRAKDALPSFAGVIIVNKVVSKGRMDLYRKAASEIEGVKVTEIVGPNTTFLSPKDHQKKITGPDQSLIGITATQEQMGQLEVRIAELKEEKRQAKQNK